MILLYLQKGADLVKTINAVYCLRVEKAGAVGIWVVDLKNGTGSIKFDPTGKQSSILLTR